MVDFKCVFVFIQISFHACYLCLHLIQAILPIEVVIEDQAIVIGHVWLVGADLT